MLTHTNVEPLWGVIAVRGFRRPETHNLPCLGTHAHLEFDWQPSIGQLVCTSWRLSVPKTSNRHRVIHVQGGDMCKTQLANVQITTCNLLGQVKQSWHQFALGNDDLQFIQKINNILCTFVVTCYFNYLYILQYEDPVFKILHSHL